MANVKISGLPVATLANDTDQIEANQSGTSRSVTVEQIRGNFSRVDISAGNQTVTLVAATGSGDVYRVEWYGGTGSFTFQFAGVANLTFGNTSVAVATAAGEGEGHIEVKDVAAGVWLVTQYYDLLSVAGDTSGGRIEKDISTMRITHTRTTQQTTSNTSGQIYQSATSAFTFPKAFTSTPVLTPAVQWSSDLLWGAQAGAVVSTTGFTMRLASSANSGQGYAGYIAVGPWY
jgi:hypothetical protein